MKEIIAVLRAGRWQATKARLWEEGFNDFTVHRVYGRGRQKGLQYLSKSGVLEEGIRFLPKRMLTLFVKDEDVETIVEILIAANRTGEIGDGKIFVCPVEIAEKIRTGERAEEAVV